MPHFSYTAKNSEGQAIKGTVEASSYDTATDELRERQLIVLSLKAKSDTNIVEWFRQQVYRVSVKEITFFSRQLAVMIGATIPVVRSLRALTRQTKNEYFQVVIADIASDVDGGAKLSQALMKYPKIFDQFFIHMVRSGETTGRLDKVLDYLANQKEKDYSLRSRVRGAMVYPAFIISVMGVVGVVMMVYVLPQLTGILTQNGATLPLTTRVLMGISDFMMNDWWLILLVLIVGITGVVLYVRTENGNYAFDYLKIRLPILGPIYQRITLSRFCISLSNLLASGVTLPTSLGIVGDIVDNAVYRGIIQRTIHEVESGNSISSVFVHQDVIPPILTQMVSVGEETGRLDDILSKLGDFYNKEVDAAIAVLTSLIEPLIIIILGIGAGFMVTGILTPIYNATTSVA